jgi:hypothetical protein
MSLATSGGAARVWLCLPDTTTRADVGSATSCDVLDVCVSFCCCFCWYIVQRHASPFRVAPERRHKSHFRSSCNVTLHSTDARDAAGTHHVTMQSPLEAPGDADAFAHADVYTDRLLLYGRGTVPSRRLMFPPVAQPAASKL